MNFNLFYDIIKRFVKKPQMDIIVQLEEEGHQPVEIGAFKDLETLVELLNMRFPRMKYSLEELPGIEETYLFIEDPLDEDEYQCGLIERKGKKVFAISSDVYDLVIGAYERYLEAVKD